jgi:hypothetical protein
LQTVGPPTADPTALKKIGLTKAPAPIVELDSVVIPPPPIRGPIKVFTPPKVERIDRTEKVYGPPVVTLGGAAAKLLPETVKEENKEDKGAPLLNDND